ncbi:thiamine transporter 2-like [Bombyx mandarina]|uniref:Thiamine transporter 2-like n=1 Tax=Bombyx mandarina TaxID=7092 RepID=A0A6J2K5W9_BOMMA|nr:thiamine transporter 2-like [Bombyx mandarina]
MLNWIKVTLILCLFGLLREIRPSEPFVSDFLVEWRNITNEQLQREIYPVGTYSYLAQLVLVFLITDFLRFKPVIILSGLSGITVYCILLWTSSIKWLQASQFFYGMYMATEVAYYTYIYAKVDPKKYPLVTSCTRIASLTGRFLSGVSSQLLIHFKFMDYRELNYITLTAQILATFWALWLPPVKYGIYFHRRISTINTPVDKSSYKTSEKRTFKSNLIEASSLILKHSRAAYSRPKVIAWSALYAVALALFVQAQTYIQILWRYIQKEQSNPVLYNGAAEAATTLLGAGAAYIASYDRQSFSPALSSAIQGIALFLTTYISNVFVSYAGYVVMGVMFHYIITLASSKIASQLIDDSCFGLIFGINTLLGVALQSLLTYILLQNLEFHITTHYYIVSGLFITLATCWLVGWILHIAHNKKQNVNSN